jgi:4-hydroxy-tetrahydrodipicolinate reductase
VRIAFFGHGGKVGSVLAPALGAAGYEVRGIGPGEEADVAGLDAALDFTQPGAAGANARAALEQGVPVVVGTSGLSGAELEELDALARERSLQLLVVSNFAIGAVLMMRFAAEAARHMAKAEIVELHHDQKLDAPSGTAARTAELMANASGGPRPPIHSLRLPGLVAHQEVILGDLGQTLTIRHDTINRESFMPGVLLAVRRVGTLERSPLVGLEQLLF